MHIVNKIVLNFIRCNMQYYIELNKIYKQLKELESTVSLVPVLHMADLSSIPRTPEPTRIVP